MVASTAAYYLLLTLIGAVSLVAFRRKPDASRFIWLVGAGAIGILLGAAQLGRGGFDTLRLLAHGLFGAAPLVMAAAAAIAWKPDRKLSVFAICCAVVLVAVAVEAFLLCPHRLVVTRHELVSPRVTAPLTILVLADIQTDTIGAYERRVLELARDEHPDLVLYAGDYVQGMSPEIDERLRGELHDLLVDVDLQPRLGAFAVGGNCDALGWTRIFEGTGVHCQHRTGSVNLEEGIRVTCLDLEDSQSLPRPLARHDGLHIVLGHCPDFVLDQPEGDLFVAGHTHGGQVQLPFLGPLLTLSRVSRTWAAGGLFEVRPGAHLLVSRGIGMERRRAPRLRFLCSPEIVVLKIIPAAPGEAAGEQPLPR